MQFRLRHLFLGITAIAVFIVLTPVAITTEIFGTPLPAWGFLLFVVLFPLSLFRKSRLE